MGKMKNLMMDIEDMLANGYDAEEIAVILGCDIKEVLAVAKMVDDVGEDK